MITVEKSVSVADILSVKPCWSEDRIRAIYPTHVTVTHTVIANATDVSIEDRRWLLTQLGCRTREGRTIVTLWAVECAASVVNNAPEGTCRDACWNAINVAIKCAHDPSEANVSAARSAARSAAYAAYAANAARSAAYSAADSVAWSAAESAAYAARSAAYSAANAARSAAYSAAKEQADLTTLGEILDGAERG